MRYSSNHPLKVFLTIFLNHHIFSWLIILIGALSIHGAIFETANLQPELGSSVAQNGEGIDRRRAKRDVDPAINAIVNVLTGEVRTRRQRFAGANWVRLRLLWQKKAKRVGSVERYDIVLKA